MDFRVVPTSMILNDLERRNGCYFALYHRNRWLYGPTMSEWLKLDPCDKIKESIISGPAIQDS